MDTYGLLQQFTLGTWNKFASKYKDDYKEKHGSELRDSVHIHLTFKKIMKVSFGGTKVGIKEPDTEDGILLVRLANGGLAECKEDRAVKLVEDWLARNKQYGLKGLMLETIVKFYKDLNLGDDLLKQAVELRDNYIASIDDKKNKDTQDE